MTGIPVDKLDPEIVKLFVGDDKDFKVAYLQLQKFRVLQQAAKESNTIFQEMVDWLESQKTS